MFLDLWPGGGMFLNICSLDECFSDLWPGGGGDAREQGGDNLQDNGSQFRWKDIQVDYKSTSLCLQFVSNSCRLYCANVSPETLMW